MKGLRHVGIVVKDLEKALHFYHVLLGLKVVKQKQESGDYIDIACGIKNISVTIVKLAAEDNSLIELLCFIAPMSENNSVRKLNKLGFSHISFTVANIDKEYGRLAKAGVNFISSPHVSPDGCAKIAFCQDIEGNFIELVEELERK